MRLVLTLSLLIALSVAPSVQAQDNKAWRGVEPQSQGKSCSDVTKDDCLFIDEVIKNCPDTCTQRREGMAPAQDRSGPGGDAPRKLSREGAHAKIKEQCAKTMERVAADFTEPVAPKAYVDRCYDLVSQAFDRREFAHLNKAEEKAKDEYRTACEKKKRAAPSARCASHEKWNGRQCQDRCRSDQNWNGRQCQDRCRSDQKWNGRGCV